MTQDLVTVRPEWAPQAAVWCGWPHVQAEWGDAFEGARTEIAGFVRALCRIAPVRVACGSREAYGSARFALEDDIEAGRVSLHTVPSGDIWLRDTGPVFARVGSDAIALSFRFNGWGGKYVIPGDTMTAGGIAAVEAVPERKHTFVLEGGAVDVDGAGRLLTTRQCLLHPNRNPDWTKSKADAALKSAFGVDQVIWLGDGLLNDHTDGHVDNIARFIGPGRAVCQAPSGPDDPNAATYAQIEQDLRAAGLDVVTIASPGRIEDEDGEIIPASHANFLISNGHILVPTYESAHAPRAIAALEAAMPDHTLIALPARSILSGGGAFHCMTQHVPVY